MIEEKRLFPAQEKDERILLILRRHWFSYMIFWFMTILLLAPLVVFFVYAINNPDVVTGIIQDIAVLACSIYILFILALLMNGFIDYYLDVYIITDRRIVDIVQAGLFKREISELNLRQIQDVSAHVDGIFPTLLHYGNINVQTAAETPNFAFKNIPHPYEISKKILDLHEAYLKKGRPNNKTLQSTILEDFSTEACYSKDTCDELLLKNINRAEEEQKNKTVIVKGQSEDDQKTEKVSKQGIIKSKKTKIKPKRKVASTKKKTATPAPTENNGLENKINGVKMDGISSAKELPKSSNQPASDKAKDEEGSLEEGKEVDLK